MRRTTTLTAAALLGAALFTAPSATAVGETCRGEAATLVGTGTQLGGTEGRDVIVTGTATYVLGYGGDDVICVTGPSADVSVNAGPGNDTVDATAHRGSDSISDAIYIVLGEGADLFLGSDLKDHVTTGADRNQQTTVTPDDERDVVDSGGGDDFIIATAGTAPGTDVITTGAGADFLSVEGPQSTDGLVDLGAGFDSFSTAVTAPGTLAVDAAAGTAELDGNLWVRWSGIEDLSLFLRQEVALGYTGTIDDDSLFVSAGDGSTVDATFGGGDDGLTLFGNAGPGQGGLDAGSGRDTVELVGTSEIRADLAQQTLRRGERASVLRGFENVSAFGSKVRLIGDDKRNVLAAGICATHISGGGGRDDLRRTVLPEDAPEPRCSDSSRSGVFDGGAGNDRLDGSFYDDVLRGGPGNDKIVGRQGRDLAVGGPGRDRCRAEVEKSC